MVVWYKVKWIDPLFAAVNVVAPNRSHDQDGTIGDLAHQQGTSGHNPDDTPGVSAERQDADSIPEVRAADVDSRFNGALVTMEDVVQATVAECRAGRETRFIYIIFNRRIWSASSGWVQKTYTGDDPHDTHAHFSGHPDGDENAAPFTYIVALGGEMELTDPVHNTDTSQAPKGRNVDQVLGDLENERNIGRGEIKSTDGRYPAAGTPARAQLDMPAKVDVISAKLDTLLARPPATFTDEQIDALGDDIAKAVVGDDGNMLTPADLDSVKASVKAALREGTGA